MPTYKSIGKGDEEVMERLISKTELLELIKSSGNPIKCKFRNRTQGTFQRCFDIETREYGYFNLCDDYAEDLTNIHDNRFDIVEIIENKTQKKDKSMKVYCWKVVFNVCDVEGYADAEQITKEIVAPDMSLEDAIKFMQLYAINEWNSSNITVRIDHIQKEFLLGIV